MCAWGFRLGPEEMSLGLGVHGEPGASLAPVQPVAGIVGQLVGRIVGSYLPVKRGT